jgi:amino acid adenylation domain-containing protein/non-ribosomal peptide synthase protein (TIGR01720 family)
MRPENIEDLYPLSPLQQGLLFHTLEAPGSGVYVVQVACNLRGELDAAAFELAWRRTVERHPALRTAFVWEGLDQPVQVVCRGVDLPFLKQDWRDLSAAAQDERTAEHLRSDQRRGFTPSEAPLMRLALFRLTDLSHRLVWSHHHLLLDGWSLSLVIREVFAQYEALLRGREIRLPRPRPYRDYIAWLLRQDAAAAEPFWRRYLAGFAAPTPLTPLAASPRDSKDEGATRVASLPADATETLRAWAKRERLTMNTLVQGAWVLLLSHYSGEKDIVAGVVSSGRPASFTGVESMLGLFINTLPMRVRVASRTRVAPWLREIQSAQAGLLEFEHSPLRQVQAWSEVPRGVPLFETLVDFISYPPGASLREGDAPLDVEDLRFTERPSYPLALIASPGRELSLRLLYDPRRLDGAAVARLHEHLRGLLLGLAGNPEACLEELTWLAPGERFQLLCEWNDTRSTLPDGSLPALFEAQVRTAPEAPAVLFGREVWTYGELNRRANRLARHLRRLGVGPGSLVGVYLERSPEMVSCLLAVLKAGGAYVSLDVAYPPARVRWILSSLGIRSLLTQGAVLEDRGGAAVDGLPDLEHVIRVDRAGDGARLSELPADDLAPLARAGDLAYVIFTSGSTGTPKGVMVRHAPVLNLIAWVNGTFGVGAADRVLFITSLCFDLSVYDVFGILAAGGSLRVATEEEVRDPERLVQALVEEPITFWDSAPAALQQLVPFFPRLATASPLRLVFLSGDWIPVTLPDQVRRAFPAARVIALGGATEATVWSNSFPIGEVDPAWASIPYGRPIPNARYHALDDAFEPCPIGVAGDLYIGGDCLAAGYAGEPALTATKFLPDPFGGEAGARLYRTGDRARFRPDGNLEFLGRLDHQVKIRGFRIELGEIEAALAESPAVRDAVVAARGDGPGGKRLVAYVVPAGEPAPSVGELRSHLAARLPEYMIPAAFVLLPALPLTANGKVDRRALPSPESSAPAREGYVEPRTPVEEKLAAIWAEVLRTPSPGIHDNFFHLGGDSILSIQIVSRARQQGLSLSSAQIFERQTIAELAAVATGAGESPEEVEPTGGPVPLTPVQRWFFDQKPADPHHFNLSLLLEARQSLHPAHLATAVGSLLHHHDALRLRFAQENGVWDQRVGEGGGPVPFSVIDLSNLIGARLDAAVTSASATLQAHGLDLERGPLLRVALLRRGAQRTDRLLLAAHHLAVDGVSWRILLEDLQTSYEQAARGEEVRLPGRTASFHLWAEHLAALAATADLDAELPLWLSTVTGAPRLPVDFEGGANTVDTAATVSLGLTNDETRALLQEVPDVYHTRIDDVLSTALSDAFTAWTGTPDLLVDVESHGRLDLPGLDLSRTVGWLTSIYPLRLAVPPGSPGARLKAVKEALRAVPRLGIGFGLLSGREDAAGAEIRRHSGAEVVFNYLGQLDQALPADSPFLLAPEPAGADRSPRQRRRHLLEISVAVVNGCLRATWTYGTGLHRRSTIEALAGSFVSSLRALLAHCRSLEAGGRTPSDFPLCALDQPAVDRLVGDGRGVEDVYPLSPLQQGMLFHTLRSPGAGVYWQQLSWIMRGDLDATALEKAWQSAIDRHSILRTSLAWEELDEPLQLVHRHAALPLERLDWSALSPAERDRHFESLLQQDRATGFDLRRAPLMRLRLIGYGDGEHLLVWSHHHLLLDGWSLPLLYAEVFTAYEAFRSAREPRLERPRPFRDYIAWQRRQEPARAEAFWRQYLRGFTVPTPLSSATQGVGLPTGTPEYGRAEVGLPAAATAALQSLARRHGLTLNTLVQGAWALLLACYSAGGDVVFGTVSAGRPADLAGAESMLGAFLNTLPVRVRVRGREELLAWLRALQADQLTLREHEHTPLQLVQEWSEVPRGVPLFGSILIFENYPIGEFLRENAGSLEIAGVHFEERTNYPLALMAIPGRELALRISYDRAAFDGLAAARALGHLQVLLGAMPARLGAAIESLPLLSAAERSQLVLEWNDTLADYGEGACLHDLIAAQVERSPERTALVDGDRQLTYRELQRRARHLARTLRSSGCGPETRVGVCMERSLEMMVALLGILEAGAAYVPIDPDYPEERLRFMLADSRVAVLLTQEHLRDRLPQGVPTFVLSPEADEAAPGAGAAMPERALPDHPAYVIYTSGSTGRPKGAVVSHRAICNRLLWMQDAYRLGEGDRVLQKTPFSFDVSVWELFWPLLAGARLVIARPGGHRDPAYLLRVIAEQEITVLHFVPPMLQVFLEERGLAAAGSLRLVACSGEALGADLQERFFSRLGARLHNLYGPTEAAVDVTFWACGRDALGPVPIGRPIANTSIHVLDPWMRPVPVGVPGELHIGGVNLARGYLGRPELTAEKFVPDPLGERPGRRLYRTGDLARHRGDGAVEFLGRLDHQVKIRGFRVELGEIEAALTDHPAVREAVVLARGDRLVAYAVPAAEPAAAGELRRWLAGRLPEYMVPAAYVDLPALPLTGNGKVDRRRLPDPEIRRSEEDVFVAPRTATEEGVAGICTRLLGIERIGVLDDFFALGGDSLKAMRLASKLSRSFDVQIGLRTLYEKPTVAGLSELIERDQMARASRAEESELSRLLAEIESMSDEEAKLLAGFGEESLATERLDSEDDAR